MMKALAMRLYHLGLDAHVVGDMTAPPLGIGDVLMVSAGPGDFATVAALVGVAQGAGARVICVTAEPEGRCRRGADLVLHIPAQTMAADQGVAATSILPMGSLYEVLMFPCLRGPCPELARLAGHRARSDARQPHQSGVTMPDWTRRFSLEGRTALITGGLVGDRAGDCRGLLPMRAPTFWDRGAMQRGWQRPARGWLPRGGTSPRYPAIWPMRGRCRPSPPARLPPRPGSTFWSIRRASP